MKKTTTRELFTEEELKEFGYSGNEEVEIIHECYFEE